MRYTEEQYNEKFNVLSDDAKRQIESEDVAGILADISRELKITPDKRRTFGGEVGYIMIGLEQKENIRKNLMQYVGLDETTAAEAERILLEKVFVTPPALPAIPTERELMVKNADAGSMFMPVAKSTGNSGATPSIVATRLGTSHNLPAEKVDLTAPKPSTGKYGGTDPYREPIE